MKWIALSTIGLPASLVALLQTDLVPASVWQQLPVVVLFCGVFLLATRYYFQHESARENLEAAENEKWREMIKEERNRSHEALAKALNTQREASTALIQMMQNNNKDIFASFSEVQSAIFREIFDEAMRRLDGEDK